MNLKPEAKQARDWALEKGIPVDSVDECEVLKAELWRFEAALNRILNNCSVY